MWRLARAEEDDAIVEMCVRLNTEDPCSEPVPEAHTRRTLARLRAEPLRGCAVVFDEGAGPVAYAFLISFWSNELGGEVCTLDEIYVRAAYRGKGHAAALIERVASGAEPWSRRPAAMVLEVSPRNVAARRLYERLGFETIRNSVMRRPTSLPATNGQARR